MSTSNKKVVAPTTEMMILETWMSMGPGYGWWSFPLESSPPPRAVELYRMLRALSTKIAIVVPLLRWSRCDAWMVWWGATATRKGATRRGVVLEWQQYVRVASSHSCDGALPLQVTKGVGLNVVLRMSPRTLTIQRDGKCEKW
eukprot:PhM_4_TR16939/c0_g1_i1/m.86387